MNTIEELIQKECPEGVEYKPLTTVANVLYGFPFESKLFSEDASYIPLIRIRDVVPAKPSTYYTGEYDPLFIVHKGDILVGMDGNFNLEKWNDRDGLLNQRVVKLSSIDNDNIILNNYLYHFLAPLFKEIEKTITGSTVKHLSAKMINSIEIPVPPLSVQHKIVEILDKFTSLEAELQAELEARKKQYEYYRNQLLDFTGREDVEWKTLPDISTNCDSKRKPIKSSQREFGQFPYYGASGIVDYVDGYIFDGDYLLISEDGANLLARSTKIAFSISGKNWVNNHAHVLKFNDDFLRKFVEYYVEHLDLTLYISAGAQPKLTKDKLNKIPIPLPKEDEIKRIVTILDKFEALINDQTASLAAEMKARHQQYEYYRDRLLTFSRKEN